MKTIFDPKVWLLSAFAWAAAGSSTVFAQEEEELPEFGFVRLVNVIAPGTGNTNYIVDGKDLYPKGYRFGQRTGGVPLPPGSPTLEVVKEGVETGDTRLKVEKDETTTLIAFAEKIEVEEGEPPKWQARILKLKQKDVEKGFRLTVVSVCREPEVDFMIATGATQSVEKPSVKRFDTTTLDLGNSRGDVELRLGDGKTRLCLFAPDSPGNYVVVLYNDEDGAIKAMDFYDPKFIVAG